MYVYSIYYESTKVRKYESTFEGTFEGMYYVAMYFRKYIVASLCTVYQQDGSNMLLFPPVFAESSPAKYPAMFYKIIDDDLNDLTSLSFSELRRKGLEFQPPAILVRNQHNTVSSP
jgi:hypothetical protein